ncbi:MAG: S26 family signal peptidase [Nanoarchaeota archaeon]
MPLFYKFRIFGHSMEPYIREKDTIIISKIPYLFKSPKINDIVAFQGKENNTMVKRIKYIKNNKFFLLGDNKSDSLDSRNFGSISREQILGKLIFKF